MILVNAITNLTLPDPPTAELVSIPALIHKDIPVEQRELRGDRGGYSDPGYFSKV